MLSKKEHTAKCAKNYFEYKEYIAEFTTGLAAWLPKDYSLINLEEYIRKYNYENKITLTLEEVENYIAWL